MTDTTSRPLRLLIVEDSERDTAHILLTLRRGGWNPDSKRVETREEMLAALQSGAWDVIVSDHHMPRFSATEALALSRSTGVDVPFIVVSGAIDEDTAIALMRDGASDYVLKDRLARLPAAIDRELDQVQERRAKRRAESLFQSVLRAAPYPSAVIDRSTGGILDGSASFAKQFLGGRGFPIADRLTSVVPFSQPERIEQILARGSGTAFYTVYHSEGGGRTANVRCYSVDHDGGSYAYVVIEDVTEQHYLKAAFDAIEDAVLIISADRRLLYANHPAEALFDQLYFGMQLEQRFDQKRIEVNGQPYEVSAVAFRFAGESDSSTIVTLHNVAEEEELQLLATRDALTGAWNTRQFGSTVAEQIDLVRNGSNASMALIDIDHFKPINDELGHAAGDAALITFANVVRAELRLADVFFRLGGDEFAIVFPQLSASDARDVVTRIYERLQRTPLRFDGVQRPLTVSCGIANLTSDDSEESARVRADRALYEAKRQGRARFVLA